MSLLIATMYGPWKLTPGMRRALRLLLLNGEGEGDGMGLTWAKPGGWWIDTERISGRIARQIVWFGLAKGELMGEPKYGDCLYFEPRTDEIARILSGELSEPSLLTAVTEREAAK